VTLWLSPPPPVPEPAVTVPAAAVEIAAAEALVETTGAGSAATADVTAGVAAA